MIQEMIENSADNDKISKNDKKIVYMHNLIYISKNMRNEIMASHHDLPLYRHLGTEKTAEKIAQNYYFLNLRKTVQNYVKNCETCIRDKILNVGKQVVLFCRTSQRQWVGGIRGCMIHTKQTRPSQAYSITITIWIYHAPGSVVDSWLFLHPIISTFYQVHYLAAPPPN